MSRPTGLSWHHSYLSDEDTGSLTHPQSQLVTARTRTQHPLQSLWSPCTHTFMGGYTLDWPPGLGLGTVISPASTGKRICLQKHTYTKVTAGCNAKPCQHAPQSRKNTPVPETHQTDGAVVTTYTTFTCRIAVHLQTPISTHVGMHTCIQTQTQLHTYLQAEV